MHGEEQEYIREAFETNWVSTVGENINQLEKSICDYIGCKNAVALSSGTSALHMAIKLAGVKQGDKVFCSDLTFAATVNPVLYEGAIPVFIDSEYDTWNMDPFVLERAFWKYPDTRIVVLANLYGTPAKLEEIQEICDEHDAILIEDAAESLGATYQGRQTGTFGKYNVISFNGNKIITTSGGGMILTEDTKAAELVRKWSTQSREPVPWYQHKELGYNYRMSNIIAGIGRGQLLHLGEHIRKKKDIYLLYQQSFEDLPVQMNPYLPDTEPNFWLSCLLIDEQAMAKQDRNIFDGNTYCRERGKTCPDEIWGSLNSYNVESRPIWKPMHMQPLYKKYDFIQRDEAIDIGADIFQRGLCLPSDIKMTKEQQEIVIEIIKEHFESVAMRVNLD